jgi:hypothetical protein
MNAPYSPIIVPLTVPDRLPSLLIAVMVNELPEKLLTGMSIKPLHEELCGPATMGTVEVYEPIVSVQLPFTTWAMSVLIDSLPLMTVGWPLGASTEIVSVPFAGLLVLLVVVFLSGSIVGILSVDESFSGGVVSLDELSES